MKILKISLARLMVIVIACSTNTLLPEFALDESFGTGGIARGIGRSSKAFMKPDGKIIVVYTDPQCSTLTQYNQDGSLDTTFGLNGQLVLPNSRIQSISVQHDGNFIAAGSESIPLPAPLHIGPQHPVFVRYNTTTNTIDSSFHPELGYSGTIMSTAVQPDDKIIVGGHEGSLAFTKRYNSDGTLDPSFDSASLPSSVFVSLVFQPTGQILAAGRYRNLPSLVRYNSNGSLDRTFGSYGFCVPWIEGMFLSTALQPNGKIIVLGSTGIPGRLTNHFLVCCNSNGTLDETFGPNGTGILLDPNESVLNSFALQPNRKIITLKTLAVGGRACSVLTCYNPNGSADTTFGPDGTPVIELPQNVRGSTVLVNPHTQTLTVAAYNVSGESILLRYRPLAPAEIEQRRLAAQEAIRLTEEANALMRTGLEVEECSICMEEILHNDLFRTPCNHFFHPTCMDRLKASQGPGSALSCPMCRATLPNLP